MLSKDAGYSIGYRDNIFTKERKYNVFTVGRAKFDRWFAEQAKKKGALVVPGTVVVDLLKDRKGKSNRSSHQSPGWRCAGESGASGGWREFSPGG